MMVRRTKAWLKLQNGKPPVLPSCIGRVTCARRIFRAYRIWALEVAKCWTWGVTERPFVNVTPKILVFDLGFITVDNDSQTVKLLSPCETVSVSCCKWSLVVIIIIKLKHRCKNVFTFFYFGHVFTFFNVFFYFVVFYFLKTLTI